jgi:hypothetical protein
LTQAEVVGCIILLSGVVLLALSIQYSSTAFAFMGLGLTFWGALLLYIRPTRYVQSAVLQSTIMPTLKSLDQILSLLNFEGRAVYLPPKTLEDFKTGKILIPLPKDTPITDPDKPSYVEIIHENPKGIVLNPPGVELANLYEEALGRSFAQQDLSEIQTNLPKILIEDLEVADNVEIHQDGDCIRVKITGSIFSEICRQTQKLKGICGSIGCPLCSSIAIAISRATGKPLRIEEAKPSEDGKTVETTYRTLEDVNTT